MTSLTPVAFAMSGRGGQTASIQTQSSKILNYFKNKTLNDDVNAVPTGSVVRADPRSRSTAGNLRDAGSIAEAEAGQRFDGDREAEAE